MSTGVDAPAVENMEGVGVGAWHTARQQWLHTKRSSAGPKQYGDEGRRYRAQAGLRPMVEPDEVRDVLKSSGRFAAPVPLKFAVQVAHKIVS